MEILLEPTSNKLLVERFNTIAGNDVKEILLKLNLPDHKSILTDSKEYIKMDLEVPGSIRLTRFIAICSYSTGVYKDIMKAQVKTISIGGRLTLLKSVFSASPLYNMSIFKVPKGILKSMEAIRSNFFNGIDSTVKKITWATWDKILAYKKNGGLGVSSFHALNRALLLKWVWRFISQDGSLWIRIIQALYGPSIVSHPGTKMKRVFWYDKWIGDKSLHDLFPRLFALELVLVADKMKDVVGHSFRRPVRAGSEHQQMVELNSLLDSVSLSQSHDRVFCDLTSEGEFRVKEVRNFLDNLFLPSHFESTRWVKYIPIKINVFAWRARRDYLPTRANLNRRGIILDSSTCPLCQSYEEDINHVLFRCELAQIIIRRICRWWELGWQGLMSFSDWQSWFSSIRLPSKVKNMLEGVFCVAWWSIWGLRNRTIFNETPPRRSVIFDDIVSYSFIWCSSRYDVLQRCAMRLDTSVSGLIEEFESGWKGGENKKGEYGRKLVEYCSSKTLYEMCKDVEQTIREGTFSQLTFDMMLAWEMPTSADEQSHTNILITINVDSSKRHAARTICGR
nr:RNA-directed DNA polymerase, eukaryota [Tanacetum cinerariifolium]